MDDKFTEIVDKIYKEVFKQDRKEIEFVRKNEDMDIRVLDTEECYEINISNVENPKQVLYAPNANILALEGNKLQCINLDHVQDFVNPEKVEIPKLDKGVFKVDSSYNTESLTLTVILNKK